jgi:hypothetical protein
MKLLITTDAPVEMPAKKSTQSEKTMLTDPVATTASSEYPLRIAVLTVPIRWLKSNSKKIGIARGMSLRLPSDVVTVNRLLSKVGFFAAPVF